MPRRTRPTFGVESDPHWYKDAIIYELHVRAFQDGNGDGIGDFRGLTERLPYLQNLGVTAIWLLPFFPSPLRDDGYDISDYVEIHSNYGTRRDFKRFLREAHRLGLRVIAELVVNHTSDQHPWFQRARRNGPGSRWRDFYVWTDNPETYRDARIIFKDFEASNWTWDAVARAYYWHRFYSHQPDLNYDNPLVRRAVSQVMDFWLGLGVDGLRLDAVPYLFEREGTSCENLPETHDFLKELRRHVDGKFAHRMFLAEANQWPEDAVPYFGEGNECHMAFHFPLMPRLFMAIRTEDRYPIVDIIQQTPPIPEGCQWALFLRNHDELTLEMVTDEDRDYMYRAYARDYQARINLGIRRRLAPLLGNDRKKIELMNSLLFSMPGTPVIYYGDEIGMGDNFYLGDRNGVRTPMQWSTDRNGGFSRANPQKLYLPVIIDPEYHYEAVNVEVQQSSANSLLWWMKRLISLRKRSKVFGRGSLEFLHPDNYKVLAFFRRYQDERVLVVANLSRFAQSVELELSGHAGMVPVELFGRTRFPLIGDEPYSLTLGPHAFYWFRLEPQAVEDLGAVAAAPPAQLPVISVTGAWADLLQSPEKTGLEAILPGYLRSRRWFRGKARTIQSIEVSQALPIPRERPVGYLTLVDVAFTESDPETYALPLAFAPEDRAAQLAEASPVARVQVHGRSRIEKGILYDAVWNTEFCSELLALVARGRRVRVPSGEIAGSPTREFRPLLSSGTELLEPSVMDSDQSNTSVVYGDLFILKLFRRVDPGMNPEVEIGRFLTEERNFRNISPVAGSLEFHPTSGEVRCLAALQGFLPNQGNGWQYTLDALARYVEDALAHQPQVKAPPIPQKPLLALVDDGVPPLASQLIGLYLESARLLGQRTGELHLALGRASDDPDFAPEPFTDFYQRGLYQGMIGSLSRAVRTLRGRVKSLPPPVRAEAQLLLDREGQIRRRFAPIQARKITATRMRCHGDYHLDQVLYTGKDFIIIDFEGELTRPLSVRRLKSSPLRDVAGMLRSFHYASRAVLLGQVPSLRPEDQEALEPWAQFWRLWVSATFLEAYLAVAREGAFLPSSLKEVGWLLDAYLLERAAYELEWELNDRPDWVEVPVQGILQLLQTPE